MTYGNNMSLFLDHRLDAAITRSSQSVGERKRRGSADDGQADQLYQQTIHGNVSIINCIKIKIQISVIEQHVWMYGD